jgi:hypothetical protein
VAGPVMVVVVALGRLPHDAGAGGSVAHQECGLQAAGQRQRVVVGCSGSGAVKRKKLSACGLAGHGRSVQRGGRKVGVFWSFWLLCDIFHAVAISIYCRRTLCMGIWMFDTTVYFKGSALVFFYFFFQICFSSCTHMHRHKDTQTHRHTDTQTHTHTHTYTHSACIETNTET